MPPISRKTWLTALTALFLASVAPAVAAEPAPEAAREMFQKFVALEGSWRTVSTMGWEETTFFEVIARGSVVVATTTFTDAPDRKMITMYYLDGDKLVATHYCEARNQPHLVAEEIDLEAGRVRFRFAGGGNLPDRDTGHMDQAVFEFLGPDRLRSRWTWFQDGEERWLEDIERTRSR